MAARRGAVQGEGMSRTYNQAPRYSGCRCCVDRAAANDERRRDEPGLIAADAIDEAIAEHDEWSGDTDLTDRYLCGDCLDEDPACPRCNGDGAAYAAVLRNAGVLAA